MDLVFCGTPQFAVPTLERLAAGGFRVRLVLTQPDRPRGRGHELASSPVKGRAQDVHGKTFQHIGEELLARAFLHETDHLDGKLFISNISALKRDLIKRKIRKLAKAGEW